MVNSNDRRVLLVNRVQIKAHLLTYDVKCRRLYESHWKAKLVPETVVGIEKVTKGGIFQRMVVSNWDLLDGSEEFAIYL